MDPATEIALYALVSLGCFIISLFAADDEWLPSVLSSGALMVFWAINNALWLLGIVENWSMESDVLFSGATFLLYIATRRLWALGLAALFAINVLLDHLFATQRLSYEAWAQAGNITFIAQLLAASSPGWLSIATRIIGVGRMSHHHR